MTSISLSAPRPRTALVAWHRALWTTHWPDRPPYVTVTCSVEGSLMRGSVFRRCNKCRRRVTEARRCEHCGYAGHTWAFVVDIGKRGKGGRQVKRQGFATKSEAEETLATLLATKHRGGAMPPRGLPVGAYLTERWLPRMRVRPSTADERRVHINAYVLPRIGDIRLEDLTGDDLTAMYDDLLVRGRTRRRDPELGWGLSPTTVRHVHTILHRAFADAIRWGLLDRNPCDQADPPSTAEVKARAQAARTTWSWDQLRRFIATIEDDPLYAMWHLFATTGLRRGEMAALKWPEVDLVEGLIAVVRNAVPVRGEVIEQDLPKTASSRRSIELGAGDVEVLRQHRVRQAEQRLTARGRWREPDRVFTSPVGGRLYPPDITRRFHELTDAAGVPRMRVQDLRHTHATLMLKSGEKVKVISERLGHSTTSFTMDTYAAYIPGMQREAADRFTDRLLENVEDDEGAEGDTS